jgi:hypothetical protein
MNKNPLSGSSSNSFSTILPMAALANRVSVIPAKAGIQLSCRALTVQSWTPAFAGVTALEGGGRR